jgi:lipoprotein-anchoring transpeptidase ErfK/SrfK
MKTIISKIPIDYPRNKFVVTIFAAFIALLSFLPAQAQTAACKTEEGNRVFAAETLLTDRGYWVTTPDCIKDSSTTHAVIAFQKVERLKRTGILNEELIARLRNASRPLPRHTGSSHIEVDVSRQVLFLVNDEGVVTRILPVSTGNEKPYFEDGKMQIAHTPRGSFKIERQIVGVRKAPLGNLYNPNYFYRGVAIHGSNSIPVFPASHGCVRIPRFADKEFSRMVWIGMPVYVFD